MSTVVIYKSKYGATKQYAHWIADELGCKAIDAKGLKCDDLIKYDTIIYGGGLYAEVINGISLITKNYELLKNKNLIVFSTAITPLECRDYYDKLVVEKNFEPKMLENVKIFNFMGKMILDELSLAHKTALKSLKLIMKNKQNPSDMEKLLIELCDFNDDKCDKDAIKELIMYVRAL